MIDPIDDPHSVEFLESSKPVSTDPSDPWWQHPYIIWGAALGAIAFVVAVTWIF